MKQHLRLVGIVSVAVALGLIEMMASASTAPGAVDNVSLTVLGHTDLPSPGLDGQTKPRGQNGDVAVIGDTAFVAGGSLFHGAQATPGRICTDFGGVKVVDISDPATPKMKTTIDIADTKSVLTGPTGNNRRGKFVKNVASSASSVDVFHNPVNNKDILAITTQRCEPSFFNGARIEFWDVTNPTNPTQMGSFDPETILNPTPGGSPANGAWGIFEDVRQFTRADQPGKVFAVATTPFSIGNQHSASFAGDFRLLDVTDPANPVQVKTFPNESPGSDSNNGCKLFNAGRSAAPTPDGKNAILSWYDGMNPPVIPPGSGLGTELNDFGNGSNNAALFNIDLDNVPQYVAGSYPKRFSPNPPVWAGYPSAADNHTDAAGTIEGNAADVQPFLGPNGERLSFVSEDDPDPATTSFQITGPSSAALTVPGCEPSVGKKAYESPGQQVNAPVAYVGRGCPASNLDKTTALAADPYLDDNVNGKIVLFEGGGSGFDGCSIRDKVARAFAAGAVGALVNGGSNLTIANAGPPGGIFPVPTVVTLDTGFNKIAGFVPNRILSGTTFPTTYTRSTATNVTVKPYAVAVTNATNASPIVITTSGNHGLAAGDRVVIGGVAGNTAANGNFTVASVTATTITLTGSAGNGAYVGGGTVFRCPPSDPSCSLPAVRTDFSRYQSVANATDPVASGEVATASRFPVTPGQSYKAGAFLQVESYTAGSFQAFVRWYDAGGAPISTAPIQTLGAVTPRTQYSATVTAPANAATGTVGFQWTGGGSGTAYADTFSFVPTNVDGRIKDDQGQWGAQRIIDFSKSTPAEVGSYRSPGQAAWPPPPGAIYEPREARMLNNQIALTTWMSDGLRLLDVSDPSGPREVGSYVPPATEDPSDQAGAGPTNLAGGGANLSRGKSWPSVPLATGVDYKKVDDNTAIVVVSDINGGLYTLKAQTSAGAPPIADSPTATKDGTAPVIQSASVKPKKWAINRAGKAEVQASRRRKRVPRGTSYRYGLSEAARSVFKLERKTIGRRVGRKCLRQTRSNRRKRICSRYVGAGSFAQQSKAGQNLKRFAGKIGRRKLKPGTYRTTLTAIDASGNRSKPRVVSYKVVRG